MIHSSRKKVATFSDLGGGPCGDFPRPAALASAVHSPVAAPTLEGLPRTRAAVDASTEGE